MMNFNKKGIKLNRHVFMCVCVSVCVYIYIYKIINSFSLFVYIIRSIQYGISMHNIKLKAFF